MDLHNKYGCLINPNLLYSTINSSSPFSYTGENGDSQLSLCLSQSIVSVWRLFDFVLGGRQH